MEEVKITCGELPLRARPLGAGEISKVFGGCIQIARLSLQGGSGQVCTSDSDCCSPGKCKSSTLLVVAGRQLLKTCQS